jgi:hypothetical protein
MPHVSIKLDNDLLVVSIGAADLVARALDGAGAKLGDDAAHRRVLEQAGQNLGAIVWVDSGRIMNLSLANTRANLLDATLPLNARTFKLAGPDRVTSALGLRVGAAASGLWDCDLTLVNPAGAALMAALALQLN